MNKFLCFVHIEKAGGTTLHKILHTICQGYLTLGPRIGERFSNKDLTNLIRTWPFEITGLGGHKLGAFLNYELVLDQEVFYFTFLREPISRYISHLNWQINMMGRNWTPTSFTDESHFNNYQCYRISGVRNFDSTKKIIDEKFKFVGLLEQYNQTLVLLSNFLGLDKSDLRYVIANKKHYSGKTFHFDSLSSSVQQKIISNNTEDLKLYQYIQEKVFPSYLKSYGASYNDDVAAFTKSNENYQFPKTKLLKRIITNVLLRKLVQPYLLTKR